MIGKNVSNTPGQAQSNQSKVIVENKQNQEQPTVVYHDEKLIPREARKKAETNKNAQKLQSLAQSNLKNANIEQKSGQNFHIQPEIYQKQQTETKDMKKTIVPRQHNLPASGQVNPDQGSSKQGNLSPKMEHLGELREKQMQTIPKDEITYGSRLAPNLKNQTAQQNENLIKKTTSILKIPVPVQSSMIPTAQGLPEEKLENHQKNYEYPQKQLPVHPMDSEHPQLHSHTRYTDGQLYGWNNKYHLKIPLIVFDKNCKKCHGTGAMTQRFHSGTIPCTQCYSKAGYCKKCYGTKINFTKNTNCLRWHGCKGQKLERNSSPESGNSEQERRQENLRSK